MDSFYGGRQGRTYNIVARFNSIKDMTTAFAQSTYTKVNFGQYVMIDTINEPDNYQNDTPWKPRWSDRENGAIYRRGFDINRTLASNSTSIIDPGNGAIYVGQIPSGQPGDTIENVRINENNELLYDIKHWNMTSSGASASSTPASAGYIKALTNLEFQTTNFLNPYFATTFSGAEPTTQEFKNINYPVKIALQGDNLTVLYANKDYRENHLSNPTTIDGETWEDLGGVTAQFHIYGNCSSLQQIKDTYPKGLGYEWDSEKNEWIEKNPGIKGWLITTTSSVGEGSNVITNYNCYAYNYRDSNVADLSTDVSKECWYLMGDFKTAVTAQQMSNYIKPEKIMMVGTTAQQSAIASTLNNGGYWFVKE